MSEALTEAQPIVTKHQITATGSCLTRVCTTFTSHGFSPLPSVCHHIPSFVF